MTEAATDEALLREYVEYPFFRETCRLAAEALADADRQREVLIDGADPDPWAVDEFADAIEDLDMVQDDPPGLNVVYRTIAECNAHRRLMEAIDACPSGRDVNYTSAALLEIAEWPTVVEAAADLVREMSIDDEVPPLPTVDRIAEVMAAVESGDATCEVAGNWAARWLARSGSDTSDGDRRSALSRLLDATRLKTAPPWSTWIEDLQHGRTDPSWLVSAALNRSFLRESIGAYSMSTPFNPGVPLLVTVEFWADYSFAPPDSDADIQTTLEALRSRLRNAGMADEDVRNLQFVIEDISPGWRMPRPATRDGYRRRIWPKP